MRKGVIVLSLILLVLISSGCISLLEPSFGVICSTGEKVSDPSMCPEVTTTPTTTPTTTQTPIYTTTPAPTTSAPLVTEEEHEHVKEEDHGVPHEFQDMVNPVSATEASIAKGQESYALSCTNCHGPEGRGDGHMAMMLDPKPSNLQDSHVQENTDGALFYIITEGVEDTEMPSFKNLSEDDRWDLVNYLRTLM